MPPPERDSAQGNPETRGGAGSRGTRQLGPKGSGLEAPNDRLRDQVKKKGWSLGFYDTRNRCRNHAPPLRQSTPRRALLTTERHILPFLPRPQRSGDARYEKGGDGSVVRVTAGSPPGLNGIGEPVFDQRARLPLERRLRDLRPDYGKEMVDAHRGVRHIER